MRTYGLITALALAVAGCGADAQLQPGEVQVALTGADDLVLFTTPTNANDKPHYGVVGAVVTIQQIDAHVGGKWVPIMTTAVQVDLFKLDNKALSTLGIASLPSGKVSALRMKLDQIGDYVILKDGTKKPLLVPDNGYVKITGKINLDSCSAGTLIVDFDPRIDVDWLDGRRVYQLTCRSKIKTATIKNACPDGGSDGGGHPCDMAQPPRCINNTQCGAGQICNAGQCIVDKCIGVSCDPGKICSLGNCVNDPCFGVSCDPGKMCVNGSCQ